MAEKTLFQGFITIAAIFGLWFALSQVNFMRAFNITEKTSDIEQKLGDMFWETIRRSEEVIKNDTVTKPVGKIVARLCRENGIDQDKLKVYVIEKNEVNAFAMPGDYLIIYSGLIDECENESQLAGVIGHEIAHLQKRHVMKKMVKEFGLSVLMSMAGGNSGRMTSEAVRALSSSAYDRRLETEADYTAVDYMIEANIDPSPFADLMFQMSTEDTMPDAVYWISTHPESESRAEEIVDYIKGKDFTKRPILTDAEWQNLKQKTKFELL